MTKRTKMTVAGREYVSKKISTLTKKEKYPLKQAIAVSYSMAKKKGFKVPKYRKK